MDVFWSIAGAAFALICPVCVFGGIILGIAMAFAPRKTRR